MSSSRSRKRARARAWEYKTWDEKRQIINRNENGQIRSDSARRATKPEWVMKVESSGSQTIGGDRRSASVSGLTRDQRRSNKVDRKKRSNPVKRNSEAESKPRQVREDKRDELMDIRPKPETLGTVVQDKRMHLPKGDAVRSKMSRDVLSVRNSERAARR